MNRTKIDWPFENLYTWNPIFGCLNNCPYCYARKMAVRFKGSFAPRFDENIFFDKSIEVKKPRSIFIGSMADMFGEWVPWQHIRRVIDRIKQYPQHKYIFLTKSPERYLDFDFKGIDGWFGVTRERRENIKSTDGGVMRVMRNVEGQKTFLSAEPLMGDFKNVSMDCFDLIIVGAMTGLGAVKPKQEWVDSIKYPRIYYKKSIRHMVFDKARTAGHGRTLLNPPLIPPCGPDKGA